MNRLVVASGSSGWMKTLFSRHSILNDELPAATCMTGSPSSITLRWFCVVPSRVILLRSGFCVSIFWPNAARVAITMSIKIRFMGCTPSVNLSTSQRSLQGGPVTQTSPKGALLVVLQLWLQNLGLLLGTEKLKLPAPHFRPPGLELHGMNPLSSAVIVDQVPSPRHLHEEGFPLDDLSLAVADLIDEVNVAVFVDVYVPVNQIRNRNGDRTASSALRDHVDEFLRKGIEHDAPGTLAPLACDRVESRQPVVGVLRLPFGPLPHQVDHIAHLLAGAFLIPMQRCLGCVAALECLPPCHRVVHVARVQLGLGIGHFLLVLLALLQDQRNVDPVDRRDLPCLLVHFAIESSVDDQTAKVRQRPDVTEEVVQLFPKHVVQPADLVRGAHGQVQR